MHDAKHVKLGRATKGGTELAVVNTAIAGAEAAWKIPNRVLNTAIKTLKVVPVDAEPDILALNRELSTLDSGLKTPQGILEVARGANKGVKVTVKAIGSGTAFPPPKLGKVLTATGPAHRIGPCPHSAASA